MNIEKERIGIIFGGRSEEHEVSFMSAKAVIKAIDREKYDIVYIGIDREGAFRIFNGTLDKMEPDTWVNYSELADLGRLREKIDFAFPVVHGKYSEDGTLQGLLEMLRIPYAGCGVLSSSLCMDKAMAKDIFVKNGIPTCKYIMVTSKDFEDDFEIIKSKVAEELGDKVYVKPSNSGSSVGISKVDDLNNLDAALREAFRFDRRVIIEETINGREIETGVIGNYQLEVASVGEIIAPKDFYSYESKYDDNAGTRLEVPARIDTSLSDKIRKTAERVYRVMDCAGFARIDFFVDKDTDDIYVNEINTIPGFTKFSMFPVVCKDAGIEFSQLIERIVDLGYERHKDKNNRETVYRR